METSKNLVLHLLRAHKSPLLKSSCASYHVASRKLDTDLNQTASSF